MAFSDIHLELLRRIVREAAEAEILPRFRSLQASDISMKKSATDLVTEADILAEDQIMRAISLHFPSALVFGEETYSRDNRVIDGLAEAELAFVIDPVDGTLNFVKGLPLFGTILSVVSHGETIAGMIYDPLNDTFLIAGKGAGSYLVFADGAHRAVKVAAPVPVEQMSGVMCLMFFPEPHKSRVATNLTRLRTFHAVNCSVFDYWMVATGAAHFTANFCGMHWDHLAGTLIHSEAGGYNAHFDGSPYTGRGEGANVLSAPDKDSWEAVRRDILGLL